MASAAEAPRLRRPLVPLALVSPLWFLWRRRYVEFVVIWALLLALYWSAIMRSEGWVQLDALNLSLVALVFEPFGIVPTAVLGDSLDSLLLALMFAQLVWAIVLHRLGWLRAGSAPSIGLTSAAALLGVWGFFGLHVPGTKPRAGVISMRRALEQLATAMDSVHAARGTWAMTSDSLPALPDRPSGVSLRVLAATDSGWSVHAIHYGTRVQCAWYHGRARPLVPGAPPDSAVCYRVYEVPFSRPPDRPAGH